MQLSDSVANRFNTNAIHSEMHPAYNESDFNTSYTVHAQNDPRKFHDFLMTIITITEPRFHNFLAIIS